MPLVPNRNDVLLGRGAIATHYGNIRFRSIVESRKDEYMQASRKAKREIATSIIKEISLLDPPGRFLMVDFDQDVRVGSGRHYGGVWVLSDEQKAIDKVTHCLREKKKKQNKKEGGCVASEGNWASLQQPMPEKQIHSCTQNAIPGSVYTAAASISGSASADEVNDDTHFPLMEWANHALNSVDIHYLANESYYSSFGADSTLWPWEVKLSLALSSDAYLTPALRIAHSLADQICKAQEFLADTSKPQSKGIMDIEGGIPFLPSPGCNWADRIVVHLSPSSNEIYLDLEPIPFSPDKPATSDPKELQAMLNSVIPDTSLLENRNDVNGEWSKVSSKTSIDAFLLSASKAQIMPSSKNDEHEGRLQDETQRIYSLGLVFYELFSGGKSHPEFQQNLKSNFLSTATAGQSNELHDPLPIIQCDTSLDFATALNIMDELGSDDELFGERNSEDTQNRSKKGRSDHHIEHSSKHTYLASVEPLKMQGLPMPLCDLIANMVDCANGDLSGDESYCNMKDVRSDLRLMLDKPSKFLRNLDLDKISMTGLKLSPKGFGREEEFLSLQSSYQRSVSCGNEFAIISGTSGTGKTVLATRFGEFATETGGVFITGKFDQLQQAKPFSAIASAFDEYCNMLVSDGCSTAAAVSLKLRETLGQDACYLVKVIPNLCMIIGHTDEEIMGHGCVDAQERLQYLLCRFVEIISSSSGPITLFLDDLQWADAASIKLINRLLLMACSSSQSTRFFFLGCCREDEMSQEHPLWSMTSSVCHFGVSGSMIKLSCMDKDTINAMVSDILCLSPRLTRPLSEIVHHKTKGNPLFFSQLMLTLSKEGLLRLSLSRRRWEWDEEKIQSRALPDDVALFLTSSICRLPTEVQSALCILSCFGASSSITLIQTLERKMGLQLVCPLDAAVEEGLLDKVDRKYRFCHDRVQEAAYNIMPPEERCNFHFRYGLALCDDTIHFENEHEDMLFIAVDQLNRGGTSAVTDTEQGILIGNLNLMAGNRAMEMSDFASAFSFFDNGISFLPEDNWQVCYDLSLQLFEKASNCALAIGNHAKLNIFSEQVLTFARSFEDKLNIMHTTLRALLNASMINEAIENGTGILSQLGEDLPGKRSESETNNLIEQTRVMLLQISHEDLLNYTPMTDSSKIIAMKYLRSLSLAMLMARPASLPIVTLKIVQLSLAHGMSPMSAIGFVYFGSILAKIGHIQEGCRYVKFARNIVDRFESKDVAGEVSVMATQVIACVEPVQTALEYHLQGRDAAMAVGDLTNAMVNYLCYCNFLFWSGTNLAITKEKFDHGCQLMEQHCVFSVLDCFSPLAKSVSMLIGPDTDHAENPIDINGSTTEQILVGKSTVAATTYYFNQMYTSLMFRKYDDMKGAAKKFIESKLNSWTYSNTTPIHALICGLASFWIFRQSGDLKWAERGARFKLIMKNMAHFSHWNFLHKFYLLQAEEQFCNKQIESAKISYNKAISSAREHKFINDEALACELAGYFYFEIGDISVSSNFFLKAHERYHEWSAFAKASKLFEFVQSIVSEPLQKQGNTLQFNNNACSSRKRVI